MCPFASRVCLAPLQHSLVQACSRCCTRPRPDTCPIVMATRYSPSVRARTLCSCPQPRACGQFAPGPTRPLLQPTPSSTHPRLVPPARTDSHAFAPDVFAPASADARRIHTQSHVSMPGIRARSHLSAPGPTRPHPLACIRAQHGRAFTNGLTRPTEWATSACSHFPLAPLPTACTPSSI
jgi:hypothetical protein